MHTPRLSAAVLAFLSLSLAACTGGLPTPTDGSGATVSNGSITTDPTDRDAVASAIVEAFGQSDWQALSGFVAPSGVRFTPFTHVNVDTDQTFSPADIADFGTDLTQRTWGTTEGSGEPIVMTNPEYLTRYVWDHDYRTAPDVRWNAVQDRGSMIDNAQDVYPGASVVEYNFPGFDPQYGGMDWRSLRLVLAQDDNGNWKLYAVIHDEWTP